MDAELIRDLLTLRDRDQETRTRLLAGGRLYGGYDDDMQAVHRDNARRLDAIVQQHGWPGLSLVGLEGCRAAWLIAQHSNCTPDLQRNFLAAMTQAAEAGEVPARQAAFLTDRIRFNEGKPQVYGTVLDWGEDGELRCDLDDPAAVDARRAAVGLPPYQDDLPKHRQDVNAEGGSAPADLADYRRQQEDWAKAVGWR
ncbi:MAG TPA: DUF6624 domain-containing protein [Azospirillaceae bacterium]|nr:DUF6624 domain-containing protein [Azospirillaceae bacterium]